MSWQPMERIERQSIPEPNSGCWLWLGTTQNGYGKLTIGSRTNGSRQTVKAHRFSYETYCGPIPDGLFVCHKCDVRSCVNPSHLFVGTRQDNVDDRERKGRNVVLRGEQKPNVVITDAQASHIKRQLSAGFSHQDIADELSIGKHVIKDISAGRNWSHIPAPPEMPDE